MTLNEACNTLAKAVEGTSIDINFDSRRGVMIHWFSVASIECTPAVAAKVVASLRQLEQFGMTDC